MSQGRVDDADPEAREEGQAAHWGLAEVNTGQLIAEGQIAPNGVILDAEMLEAIEIAYDAIRPDLTPTSVEQVIRIDSIHPKCWGTPDARQWPMPQRFRVFDFKYGHEPVDAFENWQLLAYACGALTTYGIDGSNDHTVTVEMTIIQPRAFVRGGPIQTWTIQADGLRGYFNRMRYATHKAEMPDAEFATGSECKYCPARAACPALQKEALELADRIRSREPLNLATNEAAYELRVLQDSIAAAKARASGLESQLIAEIRSGRAVPGYHMEQGEGREQWTLAPETVHALGDYHQMNLRKSASVTPNQARKIGFPVTPEMVRRTPGALRLKHDGNQLARIGFGSTKP